MKTRLLAHLIASITPQQLQDKKVSDVVKVESMHLKVGGKSDRLTNQKKLPGDHE